MTLTGASKDASHRVLQSHPSWSRYQLGIHCMSCSEDRAKSMQFVVTATNVVASITFCQFPIPAIRLQPGQWSMSPQRSFQWWWEEVRFVDVSPRLADGRVYRGKSTKQTPVALVRNLISYIRIGAEHCIVYMCVVMRRPIPFPLSHCTSKHAKAPKLRLLSLCFVYFATRNAQTWTRRDDECGTLALA